MSDYSGSPLWNLIHAKLGESIPATHSNQPPIGKTAPTSDKGSPAKPQPRYELKTSNPIKRTVPKAGPSKIKEPPAR